MGGAAEVWLELGSGRSGIEAVAVLVGADTKQGGRDWVGKKDGFHHIFKNR